MKKFIVLFSLLSACASQSKLNNLNIGMTKQDVIKIMGTPDSTKAREGEEVLVYTLRDGVMSPKYTSKDYWVVLIDGKVKQYGRAGDYGSAEPERKHIIIENR
jgi:hypothetical protein